MLKYDFKLDLGRNSSTGLLLSKIKPHSTILEFGCATGRMTRYMKEVLHCSVYIVECEKPAFDVAMQYAQDGICDDIQTFTWAERYKDIRFDTILFADVLEHLLKPDEILAKAAELLDTHGRIYVSIPNITHNDILLKAISDHFDYTSVGILDDTHVHFWGYENIVPFANQCGLRVIDVEGTYCDTGKTEQGTADNDTNSILLLNYLKERRNGDVYQFVITLDNRITEEALEHSVLKRKPKTISRIYVNDGEGFKTERVYEFDSVFTEPGCYSAHFILEQFDRIVGIRFDPLEGQNCIIQNLSIRQNGKELPRKYSDHISLQNGVLMLGPDPMIFADLDTENKPVIIDADIVIEGEVYLTILKENILQLQEERSKLTSSYDEVVVKNDKLSSESESLRLQMQQVEEKKSQFEKDNQFLKDELVMAEQACGQKEKEIDSLRKEIQKIEEEKNALMNEKQLAEQSATRLCNQRNEEIDSLKSQIKSIEEEKNALLNEKLLAQQTQAQMENENDRYVLEIVSLKREIELVKEDTERLKASNSRLEEENKAVHDEANLHIQITARKEELLIEKEAQISAIEEEVSQREQRIRGQEKRMLEIEEREKRMEARNADREQYIHDLEALINCYKNRRSVKVMDKIKDIFRRH